MHFTMRRLIVLLSITLGLTLPPRAAQAGTHALGFELGVSTYQAVWDALLQSTSPRDAGENAFSRGRMIDTDGRGYGLEGLEAVTYIFDTSDKLAAVVLRLDKSRFGDVYAAIAAKHALVRRRVPFVGDRYVMFRSGDGIIELEAPHLGFDLHVRYMRRDLVTQYRRSVAAEAEAKKRHEASSF